MPSLSPQRSRKVAQSPLNQQGPMQNITPREMTPSPSFREKQRTIKAHSMPTVPSLGQVLAAQAAQNGQLMYPQAQQPSPTASNSSHQSRRSPPPTSRISPVAPKTAPQSERPMERQGSPPPSLHHAHSTPIVPQLSNQSVPNPHHPRPVPRGAPPAFLASDRWAATEQLMAELERNHFESNPAGTAGVAYAGGAASSGHVRRDSIPQSTKDLPGDRARAADRSSPKDSDSGAQLAKRQVRDKEREMQTARESPQARERSGTVSSQHAAETHVRTPEYRGSPQYQTPIASPGERTAAYAQYVQDPYHGQQQSATQAVPRKPVPTSIGPESNSTRLTPPAVSKLATTSTHTPPLQAMGGRPPDRSLPLQEPEEDNTHDFDHDEPEYTDRHHASPTPSSDIYPEGHTTRYDNRHERHDDDDDDDDGTLNEEGDEHVQQNKSSEDSESGFTPRSPSAALPERPRESPYSVQNNQYTENQKTIRAKHRSGSTDQLGMRGFDPAMFEHTVNSLRNGATESLPANLARERTSQSPPHPATQPQGQPEPPRQQPQQQQQQQQQPYDSHQYPAGLNLNRILDQRLGYGWNQSSAQSDDMQSLFDDPTSSYLQTFLRSASTRPNAPIPPTPHSHTAAPSPSPLISAMPSDFESRQIGSPYPYPFTHIRRSTVSGSMQTPSTNYDMNNPAVVREQIALQMQIYALNNGLAPASSESAFSPSSTPFPGPGYNPWAFVPAGGGLGLNGQSIAASIRSSPSHEPVSLPPPPMRGRGGRRREQNGHVHSPQTAHPLRRVKPPPRVESTQPRDTSPEPSSGEETAGEERFVDQFVREAEGGAMGKGGLNGSWNQTQASPQGEDDDGEWVDEEEDGEEDDLLDLEFHPSYVSNPQRRRRRFDTRWDTLIQAFQALDRETDSAMVLLAAPSHSTKLHALTSRSIRRDPALTNSTALASLRRSFSHLAAQRRASRKAQRISLAERLSGHSESSADGSPGSGSPAEVDLRRALDAALGSLGALSDIYAQREARWRDEVRRQRDDNERVQLLLQQALGINGYPSGGPQ